MIQKINLLTPKKKKTSIEKILAKEGEKIEIKKKPEFDKVGPVEFFHHLVYLYDLDYSEGREEREANRYARIVLGT